MRVLVATDQWSPDAIGGSARVASGTSIQFARRGHDVVVLCPAVAGLPSHDDADGVVVRRELRRGALPQTITDVFETWRRARRLPRPDVLVAHQATVGVGLLLAQRGVPLVHVYHASAPLEQRFIRSRERGLARLRSRLLDPLLVLLERISVRRARAVVVLSAYSESLVRRHHPGVAGRIVHAGGALELERFREADRAKGRAVAGVSGDRILLLTVRRLEPRMGIEELVRATALLAPKTPVELAVAGTGDERPRLERLAAELGIEDRVRFLGRVAEEDLANLYAGADLFVLPTVAYEGFGISTIESLASGTAVVGTPVGATPELLGPLDPALVADGVRPEDLAAAIERALGLLSNSFRGAVKTYAERFGWETVTDSWLAALEAATAPERRS